MKLLGLVGAKKLIQQARAEAEHLVRAGPVLCQQPQLPAWLATMLTDEKREATTCA